MANFRNRKFTTRTTISKKQIDSLRATKLKNATNYKETKFYSSKAFDRRVKQQTRLNRITKNQKAIKFIENSLGSNVERGKAVGNLFKETTKATADGVKTVNKLSSLQATRRIEKAVKQIKQGNFKIKNYVKAKTEYNEKKKHLPKNPTIDNILDLLVRTDFYLENKKLVQGYNRDVRRLGKAEAANSINGKKLRKLYNDKILDEEAAFFAKVL